MLWRGFWRFVWNLSEWAGIGLGRLAPWVFNQVMEKHNPKRVN